MYLGGKTGLLANIYPSVLYWVSSGWLEFWRISPYSFRSVCSLCVNMLLMELLTWVSFHASGVLPLRLWFCVLWFCVWCYGNSSIPAFISSLFAWHFPWVLSVLGSGQDWYGLFGSHRAAPVARWVVFLYAWSMSYVAVWRSIPSAQVMAAVLFMSLLKSSTCPWALSQVSNLFPLWCLCSVPTTRLNLSL